MAVGPPDTTTPPTTPKRLRRGGGWVLYLVVLTCPVGKLATIAIAGSAFGLTLNNPWIVGGALVSIATAAVLLTRHVLRNRASHTQERCGDQPPTARDDLHDDLDG